MPIIPKIAIAIVAALHLYFMYLEMFAWTKRGPKVFKSQPPESFEATKVMAKNQGLYNGFLAAGLIWSLLLTNVDMAQQAALFFLACVTVAGLYGAVTVQRTIFFVQALPAAIAIGLVFAGM